MERADAEKLLQAALSLDAQFGALDTVVSRLPEGGERKEFARQLGDLIGHVNDAFIRPIVRMYPDLDPDTDLTKP